MPTIKKNLLYQNAYQLLTILIPLALAPYLSRVLGAEGIGVYSYTFSVTTYFVYFAMLGINHHGARAIASVGGDRETLNKTFSNLLVLHLAVSVIAAAAFAVYCMFSAEDFQPYFAIQSLLILAALMDVNWFFMGMERFKITAMRGISFRLIMVVCVFIFVKSENDLWIYALIVSAGALATQAVIWLFLKRYASFVKPSLSGIKPHIKPVLLLFVPIVALSVYRTMNKIMLGAMTDNVQLGFFANAEKIILVPIGFITAFNAVMVPRMSRVNARGDETEKNRLTMISMKYVMLLAFALAFGIAAIANDFAPLFFGGGFEDCGGLITGLCALIPFLSFQNVITSQYLIPNSKDNLYTIASMAGAVVSIVANALLIPKFQAMGAVAGLVSAEAVICVAAALFAKKALPLVSYLKNSVFFLFAGFAMFFLTRYVGSLTGVGVLSVLVRIFAGTVFYLGVSAAYLYLTKDEFFMGNISVIRAKFHKNG
ncbi:MAG: flippase [Oscillospiraceae bacterium]|jgi:O-antigen/teichoic acid export membrane protein|nr:flippase [Oscillospiraceae bacterium]